MYYYLHIAQRFILTLRPYEWPHKTGIPVVGTYVGPVELLVFRARRSTRVLPLPEEVPLTWIRVRQLLVSPLADVVQPMRGLARVVCVECLEQRIILIEVCG